MRRYKTKEISNMIWYQNYHGSHSISYALESFWVWRLSLETNVCTAMSTSAAILLAIIYYYWHKKQVLILRYNYGNKIPLLKVLLYRFYLSKAYILHYLWSAVGVYITSLGSNVLAKTSNYSILFCSLLVLLLPVVLLLQKLQY